MWAGLANTCFWIDPATGIGGVYLSQVLPFADKKSLPLYYAFDRSVAQGTSCRGPSPTPGRAQHGLPKAAAVGH
jgi:CubicO group peptidase (beta-lactamase class C family)